MGVKKVVARMYDIGQKIKPQITKHETKDFGDSVSKIVAENDKTKIPNQVNNKITLDKVSESVPEDSKKPDSIDSAVSYTFSFFVKVSQKFTNISQNLGEEFKNISESFFHSLQQSPSSSETNINKYLGSAHKAASQEADTAKKFLRSIKSMQHNTLQSMVGGKNVGSLMSGVNLSTNSALPGTTGSDIAKLYLSAAASGPSAYGGVYQMSGSASPQKLNGSSGKLKLVASSGLSYIKDASHIIIKPKIMSQSSAGSESTMHKDSTQYPENLGFLNQFLSLIDNFIHSPKDTSKQIADPKNTNISLHFGFNINRFASGIDKNL